MRCVGLAPVCVCVCVSALALSAKIAINIKAPVGHMCRILFVFEDSHLNQPQKFSSLRFESSWSTMVQNVNMVIIQYHGLLSQKEPLCYHGFYHIKHHGIYDIYTVFQPPNKSKTHYGVTVFVFLFLTIAMPRKKK